MIAKNIQKIKSEIGDKVTLVAVSKTKPIELLQEAYNAGQIDFGENKVQELCDKYEALPKDIKWHMIGHLQSNKVKYIAPFVHLIHGVDSLKLLQEIDKRAEQNNRKINCLLQVHIAEEETKFGFSEQEILEILNHNQLEQYQHINIVGLMGMATYTFDDKQIEKEFTILNTLFNKLKTSEASNFKLQTLSMGMSGDYKIAIACGSNMIRVGSAIFGNRK